MRLGFPKPAAAVLILSVAPGTPAEAPQKANYEAAFKTVTGDARVLFDAANRERVAAALPALGWDPALARAAQKHAELLAEGGGFEHQLPGEANLAERASAAGARFSYIAENIAAGPDPETIHAGWMHSPGHRSNLLSSKVNSVGIAVVQRGDQLYAVQDFARASPALSLKQQEEKFGALLSAAGFRISDSYAALARSLCAGAAPPRVNINVSVLHFETSELDTLPAGVVHDLRRSRLHAASVGACTAAGTGGFTQYKFAVFLF
jgi:uncharacterized protein YkwD